MMQKFSQPRRQELFVKLFLCINGTCPKNPDQSKHSVNLLHYKEDFLSMYAFDVDEYAGYNCTCFS